MNMKKTKILGVLLAGMLSVTGIPTVTAPLTVSVSAASKLSAPTGISATVTDTTAKITWKKVSGADAYRVYMLNSSSGKYETYMTVSGTTCNVTDLSAGKTYKFKIATLVKSGSKYTEQNKTSAQAVKTKLSAPKNVKASASGSAVTISWNKVSGADKYRIFTYDSASDSYKTYKDVTGLNCKISGLKAGTYKFKVAALVKSGSKYTAQVQSSAVSAKVTTSSTKTASFPVEFPAFGTGKAAAKKAMGFDFCVEDEYAPGIYGVGSVKNINGVESMVFLYFDKNDKFMYGAAVIPNKAYTFSQLESMIKKSQGKAIISLEKGGQKVVEWYNEKENVVYALIGSDKNDTMYGAVDFSNSNIRTGEDPETALQNILSMLG